MTEIMRKVYFETIRHPSEEAARRYAEDMRKKGIRVRVNKPRRQS